MSDVEPYDHARNLEIALERELLDAAETPPTVWERLKIFFTSPISLAIAGFILSGVPVRTFSKWLDDLSKTHGLKLSSQQRATKSVKVITELIYERQIRTGFIEASIRRNVPSEKLKDPQKSYEDIVIRYNTQLQSTSFRVREMVHG